MVLPQHLSGLPVECGDPAARRRAQTVVRGIIADIRGRIIGIGVQKEIPAPIVHADVERIELGVVGGAVELSAADPAGTGPHRRRAEWSAVLLRRSGGNEDGNVYSSVDAINISVFADYRRHVRSVGSVQGRRRTEIPIVNVVSDGLIGPIQLTGGGIEGKKSVGVKISAGPHIAGPIGIGIGNRGEHLAGRRIE